MVQTTWKRWVCRIWSDRPVRPAHTFRRSLIKYTIVYLVQSRVRGTCSLQTSTDKYRQCESADRDWVCWYRRCRRSCWAVRRWPTWIGLARRRRCEARARAPRRPCTGRRPRSATGPCWPAAPGRCSRRDSRRYHCTTTGPTSPPSSSEKFVGLERC